MDMCFHQGSTDRLHNQLPNRGMRLHLPLHKWQDLEMEALEEMAVVGSVVKVVWELAVWVGMAMAELAELAEQEEQVVMDLEMNRNTKLELRCHHRFGWYNCPCR